ASGASFRFGQYQNESRSGSLGCKAVATKRDRPRAGWLQIVADLARRRCRFRPQAAGLFQKDLEICAASRFSKSAQRANQRRRHFDDRQICCARTEDKVVCDAAEKTNRCPESFIGL